MKAILNYSKMVNNYSRVCKIPFNSFECLMVNFVAILIVIVYPALNSANQAQIISVVVFFMTFAGLLNSAFMKIMFLGKNFYSLQMMIGKNKKCV